MRARPVLMLLLTGLAGCGPEVITPETPEPSQAASVAAFADERALLATRFELDKRAFVATADGLVFVVDTGEELHLLLSRAGNTEEIEILARVERHVVPEGTSGGSSHVVACPDGVMGVRHYLFGQDTREMTKTMIGLEVIGGEVVDGLWVMAILDEEIAPERRWEIRDALGIAAMEGGTGALFLPDGARADGQSTLCESLH